MEQTNKIVDDKELSTKMSKMPDELKNQVFNFVEFLLYKEKKKNERCEREKSPT